MSNTQRLFDITVANAKRAIGPEIFAFQPLVIQKALVAREILTVLNAQDEDIVADARIRALALALDATLAHTGAF